MRDDLDDYLISIGKVAIAAAFLEEVVFTGVPGFPTIPRGRSSNACIADWTRTSIS